MQSSLADQINRLPYETWMRADESARLIGLPAVEVDKVLRAGRRRGTITVSRSEEGSVLFKRVRRHRLPQVRLGGPRSWPSATPTAEEGLGPVIPAPG
ncbi:hypothetical protein [Streptomyces sp. NPDC053427]|uniref:hypothetical protein n=1 Tax=Streptomyces sp. NPDC053427 TaxID=3365701 RepID=UPI0037D0036F